jgi:hypothetical protein
MSGNLACQLQEEHSQISKSSPAWMLGNNNAALEFLPVSLSTKMKASIRKYASRKKKKKEKKKVVFLLSDEISISR